MSAGKGDTRRPAAVTDAEFAERWRRAFGDVVKDIEKCPCAPCAFDQSVIAAWAEQIDAEHRRLVDDDRA